MGLNGFLNVLFTYRFLRVAARVYDAFDREGIGHQLLSNRVQLTAGLFGILTIPEDVGDIVACLSEDHSAYAKDFRV